MTKTQYRRARRLIRDNGRTAYAWIAKTYGWVLADKLRDLNDAQDWLKEREDIVAYRRSGGIRCTPRDTRPIREYQGGRWLGVQP